MLEREERRRRHRPPRAERPANAPERAARGAAAEPAWANRSRTRAAKAAARDEGIDWSNVGSGRLQPQRGRRRRRLPGHPGRRRMSLREHLDQQIALSPLSDRDRALVRFLIEALDDDGYLHQPLEDLLELLPQGRRGRSRRPRHRPAPRAEPRAGRDRRAPTQECLALQPRPCPSARYAPRSRDRDQPPRTLLAERNFARIRKLTGDDGSARSAGPDLQPDPTRLALLHRRDAHVLPDVVVRSCAANGP